MLKKFTKECFFEAKMVISRHFVKKKGIPRWKGAQVS